jgi:hypothetical protein
VKNDRAAFHAASFLALAIVILLAPGPAAVAQETPPDWVPPMPTGFIPEPAVVRKSMNASDGIMSADREPADGPDAELGHIIIRSSVVPFVP